MSIRRTALVLLVALLASAAPRRAAAGDGEDGTRAGLRPISLGRAATLPPVTVDRAAGLAPVTRDRAANLPPVTRNRAAGLRPVTTGRAAGLSPVTTGRAANLPPVTADRAAGLAPVTVDRAAGPAPVTVDRAAGLSGVTLDRAAGLAPITVDRVAGLSSVTVDRAALLRSVVRDERDARVLVCRDGYLAPDGLRRRVASRFFDETFRYSEETPFGSRRYERRITERFESEGIATPVLLTGSVLDVLDTLDPYGPHRFGRRPLGENVPEGVRRGRFYFPAAYFLRPVARGAGAYNKGWGAIIVPRDVEEAVPEDFDRTLRQTHFPLAIGDMAFKDGSFVQAALAFRDAVERRPDAAAGHFALSDALVALRNYGYAADEIRDGLALAPKWADGLDRRGVYGDRPELVAEHIGELESFLDTHGQGADGWFLLGYLRMTSGDPEARAAAPAAFREALARDPSDALSLRYAHLLETEERP